jgi:basic membrane protein A
MGVYAPGKSVTLTSAMKRYDVAAHYLARVALENRLPLGKIVTLGVADGGVGLPLLNPNLSPEIAKTVSQYEVRLRDGAITVREEL